MTGSSTFSFHKTTAFLYDTTFPITHIIQLVGFCTAVGAIPLFNFVKKTTNSKFGEACLLPLIVRELKEQQFYMTTLTVPTLLVARVRPGNKNRSTRATLAQLSGKIFLLVFPTPCKLCCFSHEH